MFIKRRVPVDLVVTLYRAATQRDVVFILYIKIGKKCSRDCLALCIVEDRVFVLMLMMIRHYMTLYFAVTLSQHVQLYDLSCLSKFSLGEFFFKCVLSQETAVGH